jgi:hypothetical protein
MYSIARLAVLVAALASLLAVMSSSAGALTWTNLGSTTLHATGTGGKLHVGNNTLTCTAATATGTAPADLTGPIYAVTGTALFTPCTLAGQPALVNCSYTLTAAGHSGGGFDGLTTGNADVICDAALEAAAANKLCHITGLTPGSYRNPSFAGGTGTLTLSTNSTLDTTNGSGGNCPLGTGTSTLTHQSLTTTAAATPTINTD